MAGLMGHLRRNLVAYLALLVALGGTGYAAGSKLLPANSVGSRQVVNHSLRKVDFKRGTLLRGARGPIGAKGVTGQKGDKGDKGDRGPAAVKLLYETTINPANAGGLDVHRIATLATVSGLTLTVDCHWDSDPGHVLPQRELFIRAKSSTHGIINWTYSETSDTSAPGQGGLELFPALQVDLLHLDARAHGYDPGGGTTQFVRDEGQLVYQSGQNVVTATFHALAFWDLTKASVVCQVGGTAVPA
jgi:hypothetical protein